jgi:flagellar basal body-associated protein FliL
MSTDTILFAIIVAVCTLLGTAAGGYFAFLGSKQRENHDKLRAEHRKACDQIKAYWNLEALYARDLGEKLSKDPKITKEGYREQVQNGGYARPTWTERDAQNSIDRFC